MLAINLLSWRDAEIIISNRRLVLIVVITIFLTILLGICFGSYLQHLVYNSNSALHEVNQKINAINMIFKDSAVIQEQEQRLQAKIKAVKEVLPNRALLAAIFDDLPQVTPQEVILTQLELHDNLLTVKGISENENGVRQCMEKMQALTWVINANLVELMKNDSQIQFELEISFNSRAINA